MIYDLTRFSPGSFQCFAQTLALQVFGPGLQVYGSGPDGGRDASFIGRPNYPSASDPWDGYTVVQAKFKEKPTSDGRDADWLVAQIRREQEKWLKAKNYKRPHYYLVISNVDLSPMPATKTVRGNVKRGGLLKVESALAVFKKSLKIKECHVWPAEKLQRLIESAPEAIKRNYAVWITPSDLLWRVMQEQEGPEFSKVMARAAAQDIRENKFTRLQEAGHSSAENTLLSDVFVDLPVTADGQRRVILTGRQRLSTGAQHGDYEFVEAQSSRDNQSPRVAELILRTACEQIGPKYYPDSDSDEVLGGKAGRIVLMGGPGQGKSTIGQFLIQYFQAQLLSAPKAPGVAPETVKYARSVLS